MTNRLLFFSGNYKGGVSIVDFLQQNQQNDKSKGTPGRPRNTWRRDLDKERARMGVTWGELCRIAEDRDGFKALIGGLCSQGTSMATV